MIFKSSLTYFQLNTLVLEVLDQLDEGATDPAQILKLAKTAACENIKLFGDEAPACGAPLTSDDGI